MVPPASSSVEAPSGKDAAYENFPVGSFLLPARLRPHVAVFYTFARAIDDIADTPTLTQEEKIRRLDGFAAALKGDSADPAYAKGARLRESMAATDVPIRHGLDLIAAFKQDAVKPRYRDWDDLMGYCILSAAPVGRYLLDLHGGSRDGYGPSDALCMTLQVINHLQDCQDDYRTLNRVYLPGDWMAAEGAAVDDLDRDRCTPALRRVIDRALDATEQLMIEARRLPAGLVSRRLALESGVIVAIADALIGKLRREDPLARRVKLNKASFLWHGLRGAAGSLR
ncbi:MAG: squalene synthase HpnC [Alphaproteobacteria bacterium]|nr:squalene synthase HpnC [Alphaproteobacteria bacterium]